MDIQFKKGVLELCVLTMLMTGDKYGYEIAGVLSKKVHISDGAIYPVLRRLKEKKLVNIYLKESQEGPARKYFTLTELGESERESLFNDWKIIQQGISDIMEMKGGELL